MEKGPPGPFFVKSMSRKSKKQCVVCNRLLVINNFEQFKDGGFRATCKACRKIQRARRVSLSPQSYLSSAYMQLKLLRRKQNIEFSITEEEVCSLWDEQQGRCAISGVMMTHHREGSGERKDFNASIDRINPSGPYTKENVQLVATRVNIMKHTLSEDMFLWWVRNIYEKTREQGSSI